MFAIRFFGRRLLAVRKYHGFKRPVVPSDFDIEDKKWFDDDVKKISKEEFAKKGEKSGRDLYYPKYGGSIYDDTITVQYKEQNSRED